MLSYCKSFSKGLKLMVLLLIISPVLVKAQMQRVPNHKTIIRQGNAHPTGSGNVRTNAVTCPTGPITFTAQDTLGNVFTNPASFACNATPFTVFESAPATGGPTGPCVETIFTNYHNNLFTNGSETYIEGGVPVYTLCPTCAIPIGDPFGTNPGIPGTPWNFSLYGFDPTQSHEFAFCRAGNITTNTVTLVDCWTGNPLPSIPASSVFGNATTTAGGACDTMKLAAGTDLGTALYNIAPASASVALTDFNNGAAYINTALLGTGTYVLTYSFTPPVADGCSTITGTFTFTIAGNPTVTVNSPTVCPGTTATLTANGANTYSWSPATGLSTTTGSAVTVNNPIVTTTYTVTGMTGGCSATAVSTVIINPASTFSVNTPTVCTGQPKMLIASNPALTYTWAPVGTTTISATTDTALINPASATVYTISATIPGCPVLSITDSIKVIPSPTVTVLSPTVCVGTTATITATGATSYTWSPLTNLTSTITNDTVFINNPTAPVSYTVMGMAANGCISSAVSQVDTSNHLGILSGSPLSFCFGSHLGLSAIGASTYTWTSNDPSNLDFGLDTSWSVAASIANVGTYTLAIYGESHSGHYCNGRDTVYITINPTPTVTATNPISAICAGSSVVLTATSVPSGTLTVSYGWFPATGLSPASTTANTVTATPSVTTVYLATGAYTTGCSANSSFTVNVTPIPSFTVNSPTLCLGSSDSLKVMPNTATSYSWSSGLSATTGTAVIITTGTVGTSTYSVFGTDVANGISCPSSAITLTVTVNPLPIVTASLSANNICLGSSDTLRAGGALTYTWSPTTFPATGTMVIATPTVNTTYTVTGADINGCVNTSILTTSVNIPPTFSLTGIPSFSMCAGGTDSIAIQPTYTTTINPNPTYSWTAPANGGLTVITNTLVSVTPTGTVGFGGLTYTVTATNGACQVTHHAHIQIHNPPTLIPTPDTTLCGSSPITLNAHPQGFGGGGNTYTWTPAIINTSTTTTTITPPVGTNTYVVQATSGNGCISLPGTVTITVNPVPNFTVSNSNPVFCIGGSSTLTAVPTSTIAATYSWAPPTGLSSTSNTIVTATPTVSTTYTVNATATMGGCVSTNNVLVTVDVPPVLNPKPDTIICNGQSVTLNANPVGGSGGVITYSWSPTGANTLSITDTPTITTVYTVQATIGSCASVPAIVTVTVSPVPTASASVNNPLCTGNTIKLTDNISSSGPVHYLWVGPGTYTSNIQNPTILNGTAANDGTYTLTVSLGTCSVTSTVLIQVNSPSPITVIPQTTTVCPGITTPFAASGASTYTWSPATGLSATTGSVVSASASNTTVYSVIGTNSFGCPSAPATFTLNVTPITANFIPTPDAGNTPLSVVFTNSSISGTTANTYTWNYGNGSNYTTSSITDTATHTIYTTAGTYTATLIAENSSLCTSTVTAVIIVTDVYSIVIPNIFTPNGDGINEDFVVKSDGVTAMNILIYDRWGLKMFESSTINAPWDGKNIGGKEVPDDTYFYIITATSNKGENKQYKGFITLLR